ncbi:hypothetical protein ACFL6S_16785 [Candidatus Poribacteria bacterium]
MKFAASLLTSVFVLITLCCSHVFAGGIGWEAEHTASITPPMEVGLDNNASGGQYLFTGTSNSGLASYEFEVPKNGTYFMWAHHSSDSAGSNSFFLSIDEPTDPQGITALTWDTIPEPQPQARGEVVDIEGVDLYSADWLWIRVFERQDELFNLMKIREFELTTGGHTMYLAGREGQTKADAFYLTDNFNDQPVFPDEATGILAVSPGKKMTTTWASVKSGY